MPVPQENSFFVERAPELVLDNGARYQLTFYAFKDIDSNTPGVRYGKNRDRFMANAFGTGKMPVPQENSFFVERASCPFLTMVQDIS